MSSGTTADVKELKELKDMKEPRASAPSWPRVSRRLIFDAIANMALFASAKMATNTNLQKSTTIQSKAHPSRFYGTIPPSLQPRNMIPIGGAVFVHPPTLPPFTSHQLPAQGAGELG